MRLFPLSAQVLLAAVVFGAVFPVFADGSHLDLRPTPAHRAQALAATLPPAPAPDYAPTPSTLRSAFPEASLHRMDPATFNAYVATHRGQGRLLTGAELTTLAAATPAKARVPKAAKPAAAPPLARPPCDTLPDSLKAACWDSLSVYAAAKRDSAQPPRHKQPVPRAIAEMQAKETAKRDSTARARGDNGPVRENSASLRGDSLPVRRDDVVIEGRDSEDEDHEEPETWVLGEALKEDAGDTDLRDQKQADERETQSWFVNLVADFNDGGSGGGGWGGDELAAVIYVVVGVVVVGAFLIYGIQTLVELAANTEDYPMFQDAGLRLSYSGKALQNQSGSADLYRDAYLAGLRYAVGFDRPGMDLGLAFEGGYIDVWLSPLHGQGRNLDFKGGYLVAGPMLRFGDYDPLCFTLEFLNGTSGHASIGWISKSRMTLSAKMGRHATFGGHLGAVFYDLEFLDGLGWRRGDFNRDLSLMSGIDVGWQF